METLLYMKNKGLHPIKVRATEMDSGHSFDNFAECGHTFHAKYCSLEGLSRTSDMAGVVLQYIFHGYFDWRTKDRNKAEKTKKKSFFFFLHKKLVGGRSRFTAKVRGHRQSHMNRFSPVCVCVFVNRSTNFSRSSSPCIVSSSGDDGGDVAMVVVVVVAMVEAT